MHSMTLHVDDPWIHNGRVRIDHSSDWSGESVIRWDIIVGRNQDGSSINVETKTVRLPGSFIQAIVRQTNGLAIEAVRDLLKQLETGS